MLMLDPRPLDTVGLQSLFSACVSLQSKHGVLESSFIDTQHLLEFGSQGTRRLICVACTHSLCSDLREGYEYLT